MVDDDELVQVVMAAQLKDLGPRLFSPRRFRPSDPSHGGPAWTGTHAVFTLGVTHEEQFAMEDVIMGVRHPEAPRRAHRPQMRDSCCERGGVREASGERCH